ncbi:hypothetical protein GMORB2_6764 [Geosmithia morbida]|uniref:2EXR domain-containing protein n=1 Tax=Geosmithia morbida TaxID=1094350 RepID=A0A9P5D673_9HYPO|nr:uncharacterized protein GMORB2_6764 [Geosmithia morbida]KAF4123214.1 hypothetical protein GMORB2_6764 [Geosmithia morbida]
MARRPKSRRFIPFVRLPRELRDMIWDMAITNRQAEPEIQFFSLGPERQLLTIDCRQTERSAPGRKQDERLAPPSFQSRRGLAASAWHSPKNPSGYLLDSALWNACSESRHAVAFRYFRVHRGRGTFGNFFHAVTLSVAGGSRQTRWPPTRWPPTSSPWPSRSDETVLITLRPQHDLLVFQVGDIGHSTPPDVLAYATDMRNWGFRRPLHIGIECHPSWMRLLDAEPWRLPGGLGYFIRHIERASHLVAGAVLWLVDNDVLRPLRDAPRKHMLRGRVTFLARGWRYVEVRLDDFGHTWTSAQGRSFSETGLGFCHAIRIHLHWLQNHHHRGHVLNLLTCKVLGRIKI